jgi:hypothetical protein
LKRLGIWLREKTKCSASKGQMKNPTSPQDKTDTKAQSGLSVSFSKIGDMKLQAGDATALAAYEESLGIDRDLAEDKTNAQAQRDLAVSLQTVRGGVKLQAGDAAGARAAYEESLAILRDLAKYTSTPRPSASWRVSCEWRRSDRPRRGC